MTEYKAMKKLILTLSSAFLLVFLLVGCSGEKEIFKANVSVEGAIFGGMDGDKISAELAFSPDWITNADNTEYNSRLAAFASLLTTDAYYSEKDVAAGTQNRVLFTGSGDETYNYEYDFTSTFTLLGFTDVEHIESFKMKSYDFDSNDTVTMTLAYMNQDGYDIYAVSVRGTFSAGEWASIYDIGFDGDGYVKLTGEHPEWTNKDNHKGFDIAANRAIAFIDDFMKAHGSDAPDSIFITGHSRGGSIANLLGAHYEKVDSVKSYTYTVSAIPATFAADAAGYKTVFNIVTENDFYTKMLPFGDDAITLYGSAILTKTPAEVKNYTGRDLPVSLSADELAVFTGTFAGRFAKRNFYDGMKSTDIIFTSEEEAVKQHDLLQSYIGSEAGLGLEAFCSVGDIVKLGERSFMVTFKYSDAALMSGLGKVIAYGDAADTAYRALFDGDEAACALSSWICSNKDKIAASHLIINPFVYTSTAK